MLKIYNRAMLYLIAFELGMLLQQCLDFRAMQRQETEIQAWAHQYFFHDK